MITNAKTKTRRRVPEIPSHDNSDLVAFQFEKSLLDVAARAVGKVLEVYRRPRADGGRVDLRTRTAPDFNARKKRLERIVKELAQLGFGG